MTIATPAPPATWGTFLEPDAALRDLADPASHLNVTIHSGIRASLASLRVGNRVFESIARRIRDTPIACEDQCSAKYYFDAFEVVRAHFGRVNRIVEVGVYMGGASTVFAGCAGPMDLGLDLVDVNERFLRFTHERIRRTFPEAMERVRLFHGDLPTYVHRVLAAEPDAAALVHHDGSHRFDQVVKDLASLSFVRDRLRGILIQDTHLRGRVEFMNFVDAAVYAVFGFDVRCTPIGTSYPPGHPNLEPNRYQGNYFLPDTAEGMFVPIEGNTFRYPHPSIPLEALLPERG